MTNINPYWLVKQATDPGTATLIAAGLGGGLGALWDAYDEAHDKPVENKWRRPILGALLAGLPLLSYDIVRGTYDRDAEGNRTMPFLTRYFTSDKNFWSKEAPNQQYEDYMNSKRKYYPENLAGRIPTLSEAINAVYFNKNAEWVSSIKPIPVNYFNKVTWLDASQGRTPLEAAGLVSDTLSQTGRRVGSGFVTPGQVMDTLVNAGIGYGTAWLTGKALGAMANVSPSTQKKLCEIGTWGGMLSGINNAVQRY